MEKLQAKDFSTQPRVTTAAEQKNASNLKRNLGQALLAFEKNKEWADYGHWLQKVAKCLDDYPSAQIPEKLTFAKRLAQCLNPNLPPAIHNNTIQVYSLIFRNMREAGYNWCDDLGIYSFGIFPLFQYASFQVKPKILQLYRDHYLPLGKQLIPCVTGLVVSILPGVEEQNEALQRDAYSTLDQLSECVTKKYFIGAVWMAILRNPRVRLAGIKYFSKRLKRTYIDPEEHEEGAANSDSDLEEEVVVEKVRINETIKENILPDSSLPSTHHEIDPTPVKDDVKEETGSEELGGMYQPTAEDEAFLRSLDEGNEDDITVEYPNKSSLVLNALITCLEDENVYVQKACLDFLSSHFKPGSDLFSDEEKHILFEAALNLLIKKDQQIQRRVYTWIFGPPDMENKYQITEKNIKVIDYLITAFQNLFNRVPTDAYQATLPLKVLQNFYMEHDHLVEQTLTDLAIPFLSYIYKYSHSGHDFAEEVHKSGARFMENITSYFATLLTSLSQALEKEINNQNNKKCLEIINLIEFTFKLESTISNKEENLNFLEQKEYLRAIISGILRSTSSISPDQKNLVPFIDSALNLNLTLISKLEKIEKDLTRLVQEKNLSKEEIVKIQGQGNDYGFNETLERFSKFYEKMVEQILSFQSESQISQKFLNLFTVASETIVKVQIFHADTTLTELPSWLQAVIQCIKSAFPSVAIIGIKTIQSLLIPKSKRPIYESIKQLVNSEGSKNRASDIVRRTTEKLWSLLDIHYIQNTVADLLGTFQSQFPRIFAETVSNSFQVPSITEKEAAIRRFASFWKLSSDLPKSDFIDSGTGLFIMLDFLDNDNPLLRHSSKSWILDSIAFLYRIIDPIFEILMQTNSNPMATGEHSLCLYVTDTKQCFFTEVYDTEMVQDSFKKLKSILITSSELFMRYIIAIKISERLKSHESFFENNDLNITETYNYLDLLFVLCVRYIQGHAIESLSSKFQIQNASVNASASEFLELLISHIESDELSAKMTHSVVDSLLLVLHHAINNSDYVLQVQLLNLLKVVLLQSGFCRYEGTRFKCVQLLSSKRFIPNLLKGLTVDQPYVRVQFINFISLCVGVLTENVPQKEVLTTCVISILRAYFEIILNKHLEISENNDEFEPWESDNLNFEEDGRKIEMAGDEFKKHDENKSRGARNTFTIRYQSQNEIFILLEGVRKILDFFLKFKPLPENPEAKTETSSTVLGYMRDLVTFQFLFKPPEDKKEIVIVHHSDTAKAILGDLFKIIYIFIYCWRLSREFRNFADFTALGIMPYSFEKYNEINKMIKENHMRMDLNAKNAKSLVISVLKPLMVQYTTESVNSFINYWILECQKKHDLSINPRMMKEIEILVSMNVSAEAFISALSKNQIVLDLSTHSIRKQQQHKKGPIVLNYDVAKTESQIFFLVYTYIAFSYIDINFLKKEYLTKLWNVALNFTKLFAASKAISTHLWLLEILFLLSNKYNPKEILGDYKLKKEMHEQINALLITIANTCAKSTIFYFNEPGGVSESSRFKTVLPFPPTVYELYKNYVGHKEDSMSPTLNTQRTEEEDLEETRTLMESANVEKLMFENFETDTTEHGLFTRYRLFAFKTLKRVALNLIQNSYSPEKVDRIIKRMKDFMEIIFPLMENKSPENQAYLECASELLYSQLEVSRSFLIKEYKKNIIDIFNGNDFFKCTKQTLKYWSKIIDWVVSMDKGDIFSEFLTKVSAFSFLFSRDSETKQKIKSFERICFIIYSGERDRYQDKLYNLLEKMGEVIKNAESAHPSLMILVLFCIRILFLRLSPLSLNELFRHIWPILLTLLMQIFNKKNTQRNPNLMLAALKLIEMMSIVQLEEFYINQWIFIFDYFGITIEPTENDSNVVRKSQEPSESIGGETRPKISGFIYQPYITSVLQDDLRTDYKSKQIDVQKGYTKIERKIVMTMTSVDEEVEIKAKALFLMQYLIQQNEFRTHVDPHQIESLIEGDFISLDDYIFNINKA